MEINYSALKNLLLCQSWNYDNPMNNSLKYFDRLKFSSASSFPTLKIHEFYHKNASQCANIVKSDQAERKCRWHSSEFQVVLQFQIPVKKANMRYQEKTLYVNSDKLSTIES